MRISLAQVDIEGVRQGNINSVNKCIKQIIPLIDKIVGVYSSKFPYRSDEIKSVAYFSLTKAVNKCKHDNIVGYAKWCVEGSIKNFLKEDHQVRVPRWFQDEKRATDPNYALPETISQDHEEYVEPVFAGETSATLEFYEFCFSRLVLTPVEKRVLNLAKMGYNNVAIANKIGVHRSLVDRAKKSLKEKFDFVRNNKKMQEYFYGHR